MPSSHIPAPFRSALNPTPRPPVVPLAVKTLTSFYQICTKIQVVYQVQYPETVSAVLERVSDVVTLNFDELWKPLQCLQLRGFFDQLLVLVIGPLVLVLLTPIVALILNACRSHPEAQPALLHHSSSLGAQVGPSLLGLPATHRGGRSSIAPESNVMRLKCAVRPALLRALPWTLTILFLAYPMVSSHAFLAFNCQAFDGEPFGPWQERTVLPEGAELHYLIADYNIRCYTESRSGERTYSPEYMRIRILASLAILFYSIGIPFASAALLFTCRRELQSGRPLSALSRGLQFIYKDYQPPMYFWEIFIMMQKLLLVGMFSLVQQGSLMQAAVGTTASIGFLVLHMGARPFAAGVDNILGTATNFCLTMLLFAVVLLKVAVLREEVSDYLTSELFDRFSIDTSVLTALLLLFIFFSLGLTVVFMGMRAATADIARTVRGKADGKALRPGLGRGMLWNLFISHIWGSAQDQAATIKRQLQILMPDARVFLDVRRSQHQTALFSRAMPEVCWWRVAGGRFGGNWRSGEVHWRLTGCAHLLEQALLHIYELHARGACMLHRAEAHRAGS